jgi:hypothetical protein
MSSPEVSTRDFRERTKFEVVKIMIWVDIVVIMFVIAVRIYLIFIFLLKGQKKTLVKAFYDKLLSIWEVSLSWYWDLLVGFLDLIATYRRALKGYKSPSMSQKSYPSPSLAPPLPPHLPTLSPSSVGESKNDG